MKYENPGVAADIIVEREEKILLVRRRNPPFKGMFALPGGFLEYGKETLEETAIRELKEETGLIAEKLQLLGVYSTPDRDPRGHTVSAVYITETYGEPKAGDDAAELKFFSLTNLPRLAFDHEAIIKDYIAWRKNGR